MQFSAGTHERVHPLRGRCWYCGEVCGVSPKIATRYQRYRLLLLRHLIDSFGSNG